MASEHMDIDLNLLRDFIPLNRNIWGCGRVTPMMVLEALQAGRLVPESYDVASRGKSPPWTPGDHASRIAYLVQHPSDHPICIDVGMGLPELTGAWIVTDGNHRVAAAFLRGDTHIAAYVSGAVSVIEQVFGPDAVLGSDCDCCP